MPGSSPDPLNKLLAEAESDLSRRLQEACEAEAHGVASESTAEIRRLEDTLLAAALAAERMVAARRHLQEAAVEAVADATQAQVEAQERSEAPAAGSASCPVAEGTVVRQFEDEVGRRWRAWPVVPDTQRTASLRGLGEFKEGWICFEAMDDSGRRRLPGQGRRWTDLPPEELPRLLARAINVPARKRH
jgi:hypothetical protein